MVTTVATRRQLLKRAGGAAGLLGLGGAALAADQLLGPRAAPSSHAAAPRRVWQFHSLPGLRPVDVTVTTGSLPGYVFLGPGSLGTIQGGPIIVDPDGEPVWFRPLRWPTWESNFAATSYRGQPALAWWEGVVQAPLGYGRGEGVIVDTSYHELARVRAAGGRDADVHEFRLTPQGTALLTCYPQIVEADLSSIGGPRRGRVLESVFQEIDPGTGSLLLEWRSLDHIPITESHRPPEDLYDYLHVNSIDVLPDGNLLVSARHTWTLYKLDRRSGAVIWRLGGKRSDFKLGHGARFTWQHDARHRPDGSITLFDNGSDGRQYTASESRGVVLAIDERARTARLAAEYRHPSRLISVSMGSVQLLPGGNVLVGWGSQPYASEFTPGGKLVADAEMPKKEQSYRSFSMPWIGKPSDRPAVAAAGKRSGGTTLFASWNGATEVTNWLLHAGPSHRRLHPVGVASRSGFETAIGLDGDFSYAAVTALDASSRRLARSPTIRL
jgi:hypothetical protein